ncbi:hypothetical protein HBB16_09460 [Pseudonocardia sp. MCCB 268]|nr:hypothetical protein [Pseudonocardia cytotoxica]
MQHGRRGRRHCGAAGGAPQALREELPLQPGRPAPRVPRLVRRRRWAGLLLSTSPRPRRTTAEHDRKPRFDGAARQGADESRGDESR